MDAETVVLKLDDQISGAASAARASLSKLEQEIGQGSDALRELQAQMKVVNSGPVVDLAQFAALNAAIADEKALLKEAQLAYVALGGSAQEAAAAARLGAAGAAEAAAKAAASTEAAAQRAVAAAAAEAAAVDAAWAKISAAADRKAEKVAAAAAREATAVHTEALRMNAAYDKAAAAATKAAAAQVKASEKVMNAAHAEANKMNASFDKAKAAVGNAGAAVEGINGSLKALAPLAGGTAGKLAQFSDVLAKMGPYGTAAAVGIVVLGAAVAAYVSIVTRAISASAALQAKNAKASGDVKAQALSLASQMTKLEKDIDNIFSGAQIEPFLRGLQSILSLFDENSDSANSLKQTIADMTNAAIGGMLRLAIAVVTAYTALRSNEVAWYAVKAVLFGVVATLAALFVAVGLVVAVFVGTAALIAAPFVAAFVALKLFWDGMVALWNFVTSLTWEQVGAAIVNAFVAAVAYVTGLPATFVQLGVDLVTGLVSGIASGAGAVISALTGVVSGGIKAAKAALGIASPSKVFTAMGENTTESYAGAVDDGAGDVAASTANMAKGGAVAAAGVPVASGSAETGGAMGKAINFYNCIFGGDLTEEKLRVMLVPVLETEARAGS